MLFCIVLQWVNNIYKNRWSRVICFEIFAPMKFHWNAPKIAYFTNLMLCPSPCVSLHDPQLFYILQHYWVSSNAQQSIWCGKVTVKKVITQKSRKVGNLRNVYQRQSSIIICSYLWKSLPPSSNVILHICNEWITYTRIIGLELFASNFVPMKFHWNAHKIAILYQFDVVPLALC